MVYIDFKNIFMLILIVEAEVGKANTSFFVFYNFI